MLANYKDELAAFQRLLESQCCRRIVMYRGKESGIGKTDDDRLQRAGSRWDVPCGDGLESGTTTTVTEILSRTVVRLGGLAKLKILRRG